MNTQVADFRTFSYGEYAQCAVCYMQFSHAKQHVHNVLSEPTRRFEAGALILSVLMGALFGLGLCANYLRRNQIRCDVGAIDRTQKRTQTFQYFQEKDIPFEIQSL